MPASAAPTSGATQNSHNCATAQPPTITAGPVLRAGFTEVLVTGMLIRWMSVRHRPMAIGRKARRGPRVGGAENHDQEHEGHHDFGDQTGPERVAAGRMIRVTVGREPGTELKARLAAGDEVQHRRRDDAAQDLGNHVRDQLRCLEAAAHHQSEGDGGIQMTAGDRADGEGHREHRQSKGECDA